MKAVLLVLAGLLVSSFLVSANAQMTAESPFERKFSDIKFLDAYFGNPDDKIEVSPGDKNVPFTVVFANVGSQDITGVRGQLQLPIGFSPAAGKGAVILADSDAEAVAGSHFTLTFFVNIDKNTPIQQYPGNVKLDYSRLREAGQRTDFFEFKFNVTGESILNLKALDPFLTSLKNNKVTVEVSNTGSAPISNVRIILQNTNPATDSSTTSTTNVENVVFNQSDWSLGTIDPGSLKNFDFEVYVPEGVRSSTLHTIMQISYYDAQGNNISTKRTVDYFIKGFIDARLYNIGVIDLAGKQTVIGDVINEGNTNALFAFVTLEPLNGSNIKKTTQFIDELETDSPVPFNIPIEFDGEPRYGDHDIKITIRYKDDLRNEHLISKESTITVQNTTKKPTPGIMDYIPEILGLCVIVAVIIVVVRKKRNKENQIPG